MRRAIVVLSVVVLAVVAATAQAEPMVLDKETGHYKDMSYEALSGEGLSWEQKTRIFGGETATYGELTAAERKARQKELKELLAKIDRKLVNQCEADIRAWLDKVVTAPLKRPGWEKNWKMNWSVYTKASKWPLESGAAILLRAYEIWGDEKHLKAGLERADIFVKAQYPQGPYRMRGGIWRIQDMWQTGPMRTILYAYKFSKDKKYLASAKKYADVLLPVQRSSGGWPDQWPRAAGSGIVHGMSHNDAATTSSFRMMVLMYHLTGDKKYVANLHKLGPFIKKTNLGKGDVFGWAGGYDDNGRPLRVRQYEIEVVQPGWLPRSVGPLLIWLYLMDGNEKHMELIKKAYASHETVRRKELEPWQLEAWEAMSKAYSGSYPGKLRYHPGWPDGILADGSNWGRCLSYGIHGWYPVTPEMRKKYGGLIHNGPPQGHLKVWDEAARAGKPMPGGMRMGGVTHTSCGNSMIEIRRALLEHKRGGYEGLLKFYTNPVKYTPDQYLQARVDAAKRALDARNVRLAAMRENGVNRFDGYDTAALFGAKGRWFGAKHTKWGKAYDDVILRKQSPMHTACYQWQLVYDTMLARGRIDADTAARGGRGLGGVGSMINLDSWDVIGEVFATIVEKENPFDVPIKGKKK